MDSKEQAIMATAKSKVDGKRIKTGGRKTGTPNKTTALLKDAILEAAERAGDEEGMVGYLVEQAHANPTSFMTLLGKVLPLQVQGGMAVEVADPIKELFDNIAQNSRRIGCD
jgi:hypothetical protein